MSFRLIHMTALIAAELKAELQRRREQSDPREGIISMSVAEWARDTVSLGIVPAGTRITAPLVDALMDKALDEHARETALGAATGVATWHEAQHRYRNALVHGTSHPEALLDGPPTWPACIDGPQAEPFVAFSHSEPDWSVPAPDIEGPRRPLMRGELVEWGQTAPGAVSRDVSRTDDIHERVMLDMKRHGDLLVEQQRAFDLLNLPTMVLGVDPGAGDEQHTVGLEWSGLPGDPFIALQRTRGAHGTQPWDYAAGEAA